MATEETRDVEPTSEPTFVRALMRLGQGALLVGVVLIFGSPAFVAAGMGPTAIPGLGVVALGVGGYLLGRLALRSSTADAEETDAVAAPQVDR